MTNMTLFRCRKGFRKRSKEETNQTLFIMDCEETKNVAMSGRSISKYGENCRYVQVRI